MWVIWVYLRLQVVYLHGPPPFSLGPWAHRYCAWGTGNIRVTLYFIFAWTFLFWRTEPPAPNICPPSFPTISCPHVAIFPLIFLPPCPPQSLLIFRGTSSLSASPQRPKSVKSCDAVNTVEAVGGLKQGKCGGVTRRR